METGEELSRSLHKLWPSVMIIDDMVLVAKPSNYYSSTMSTSQLLTAKVNYYMLNVF